MVIAAPVWAQVNTVWLTGGNVVINEEMNDGCLLAVIMLTSTAFTPANTQVRYHVSTEQGFNHFRNHGVAVYLVDGVPLSNIKSNVIATNTGSAGTSVLLPGLCVANDQIDTRPAGTLDGNATSTIKVILMSVAGFAIDRSRDSVQAYIRGDDHCTLPDSNGNGVVYKFRNGNLNDSCVCMSKSSVVAAGIADGETEAYATTSLKWRTDSTDYCPNSPYQRPG
ncbi:MAG: hypothetical protein OXE85_04695 [Roseovarius sp.]|nr:hypothetical protein [Roseovarius sp.]